MRSSMQLPVGLPEVVRAVGPPPCVFVVFGATGDLARRKLVPALYNLAHEGQLPERFEMVGVGRRDQALAPDLAFVAQLRGQAIRAQQWVREAPGTASNLPQRRSA